MIKRHLYINFSVLALTLIMAMSLLSSVAYAADGSSIFDPQAQTETQPIQPMGNPYPYTGIETVLLIQDVVPWDTAVGGSPEGAVVDELLAQNKLFCMITSSELGTTNLNLFNEIIIASAQTQAFYDNLFPDGIIHQKISDFVYTGGILSANLADFASGPGNSGNWSGYTFVAGVKKLSGSAYASDDINIADPSHPIITDMLPCSGGNTGPIVDESQYNDLDGWLFSAHGYFTNLPANTKIVLTTSAGVSQPVLIEYRFGSGIVIATMTTSEFMYVGGLGNTKPANKKLLANEICYQDRLVPEPPVGGTLVPANRLNLLIPSIGLIFVAGIIIKLGSRKKEIL
jgi:hypothetical protein